MPLAGCSGSDTAGSDTTATPSETIEAGPVVDRRADVLAELGSPDSFVISVQEADGQAARFESWTYAAAATQIDFLDGEVLWDIEIPPTDDGTLLPQMYSPEEFELLASRDEIVEALGRPALTEVDATDVGVDGAEVWAGEQLLLAFVDDQLVYVETYPLVPAESGVGG